jgi:general secretion pathway protein C
MGTTTIVPRALLNTYLQKMDKIWKDIGLVPVKAGEELKGFRVRFVRRGSPFDRMGIRRGDLLTAIDGEPLDNNAILLKSVRKIRNSDHMTLRIQRDNEEVELKYDIR